MPAGRVVTLGGVKPAIWAAVAASGTSDGCGATDHVIVPYALRSGKDWSSASVTGTGFTVLGAKICETLTDAVITVPRTRTAASTKTMRCDDGRSTGSRTPNRGRATLYCAPTRSYAAEASKLAAGTANRFVAARASPAIASWRARQSAQPA